MKFDIKLPEDVLEIMSVIKEYGSISYVAGGCVRDSLLGKETHDWDICTPVPVSELAVMFEEKGYKVIPTGLKHGTITVHLNGENYEITTFRRDGEYSDGRHPDIVEFTSNLIEDLSRRDFTINAMAYNPDEGLIDPFDGIDDIDYRIIRCVGAPRERLKEDGLRILRAIRFAALLKFKIDWFTCNAMINNIHMIDKVSAERINSEFCKIISNASEHRGRMLMATCWDILCRIIPEIKLSFGFPQNNPYHKYTVYGHIVDALSKCESNDLITRLAIFFHDIGKPYCYQDDQDGTRHFKGHAKVGADMTDSIMRRLRFDNKTRENVVQLIFYHDSTIEPTKKSVRRWLNKIGKEQFVRLLEIRRCDILGQNPGYAEERLNKLNEIKKVFDCVQEEKLCFSLKDLTIDGKDVMQYMLMGECKAVGYWLNVILKKVMNGELNNNREDLISWMTSVTDGLIEFKE